MVRSDHKKSISNIMRCLRLITINHLNISFEVITLLNEMKCSIDKPAVNKKATIHKNSRFQFRSLFLVSTLK